MMAEVIREEEQRAQREQGPTPTIQMVFDCSLNLDSRSNIPAANEVAVVFVGEDDVPVSAPWQFIIGGEVYETSPILMTQ
ncbi:hypothetical protein Y032_0345g3102 [Ancylostoma ceylanicum]|uniref:Uncharacterized protein n=1 Tax=Ancylostoma ceylanicum TaxID=53326 RepID=A0A016RXB1_9BILA|nr:hypothetical protein Y032_0345g3102 [Ancylostoma ceylanicum]